ncbi:MAG TPA: hypothetical protein VJV05_15700 [Pyrinomonadaceae bacterium]|nr:hypothetical protein [Pyrinomonadaceae bacterium]
MELPNIVAMIAAVGTFLTALTALVVYVRNSKLERAKWALALYEKFFEKKELKHIRDTLDDDADNGDVTNLVLRCPADFTDYLNFFEFVSFLETKGQLRRNEIKALFDYYLRCLNRHPRVTNFVRENGYENLERLLASWK